MIKTDPKSKSVKRLHKTVTLPENINLWFLPTASGFQSVMVSQFNDNACKEEVSPTQGTGTI